MSTACSSESVSQAEVALPAPVAAPVAGRSGGRRRLSRGMAFLGVTVIFIAFMAASSAPSPLYVVYQSMWGFSASTLTIIFAVYVLGLIGSLLVLGGLSDHIGRRPVLAGAVLLEAISLVLFLTAGDVPMLMVGPAGPGHRHRRRDDDAGRRPGRPRPAARPRPGRVGQRRRAGRPAWPIGALGCGALVQFAPQPTHLVYALLFGGMVLAAVVVAAMPETATRRPGAVGSLRPRLGIPTTAPGAGARVGPDHDRQLGTRRALSLARARRSRPASSA